jgi:WD40 repeat protein
VPESVVLEKAVVTCLAFSHDGKHLLGGGAGPDGGGLLWVWDVGKRQVMHKLPHGPAPVQCVAFSPVDDKALSGGGPKDANLYLWDAVQGGKPLAQVQFKKVDEGGQVDKLDVQSYVGRVAFSPDGKRALSAHALKTAPGAALDYSVRLWNVDQIARGAERHVIKGFISDPLVAFAPDGKTFAAARAGGGGGAWLYDADTGKQVRQVAASMPFYSLLFLPRGGEEKGDRLAFTGTTYNDYNVHIHDIETGKEERPPAWHFAAVRAVGLSPDGRHVASGAADARLKVWDMETVKERHTVNGGGEVWAVGFHPDGGKAFYCGAGTATLPFVEVESGKGWAPPYDNRHNGAVENAVVTPDGRYALTGGHSDGSVRMWGLKDGRQVRFFEGPAGRPATVTVSPKNWRRALRTSGTSLQLLHIRCREVLHEWTAGSWNTFLPDGRVAIFGKPSAPVWDVAGDKPKDVDKIDLDLAGSGAADLSYDGTRLAAVVGGKVVVWDVKPEKPVWDWAPPPHFGGVRAVALSSDGRHLLTANGDGTVYVIQLP